MVGYFVSVDNGSDSANYFTVDYLILTGMVNHLQFLRLYVI